jgi:hypothetical protein
MVAEYQNMNQLTEDLWNGSSNLFRARSSPSQVASNLLSGNANLTRDENVESTVSSLLDNRSQLISGSGTPLNTNSRQETANNDLDKIVQAMGLFFGGMQQPQNSNMSASDIMGIHRDATRENADIARSARFDIAGLSKEEQERNQKYRIENANVDAAIQRARDMLQHNQGMQQDMQIRLMNLNDLNQSFENTKGLNAQQSRDNENQRKYSLAESTLGNIANIYQNNKPANLLQGVFG